MKVLFLVPYPVDNAPSQRFRFEQYLAKLRSRGCSVTLQSFLTTRGWDLLYSTNSRLSKIFEIVKGFLRRVKMLFFLSKYDFVFIHREVTPVGPPIIEWLIAFVFRKKIIYDFDDAIWLEDQTERGTLLAKLKWKSKISNICKWSYRVSVGNEYLGEFAKSYNRNVIINPTTIDLKNVHNLDFYNKLDDVPNRTTVIGWTGTHSTMHYLEPLIPVLQKLEKKFDFVFMVISNQRPVYKLKSLHHVPWSKASEISDLMKMDIGVMPLTDDEWSKGKCGFKILQYMALQKPALASPVGINSEIIEHKKNGFICSNEEEWLTHLESLLQDSKTRQRMGKLGRKRVVDHFSVSSNSDNFLSLFEK